MGEGCCAQREGCCTAKVWAVVLCVLGIGFILVATLIPPAVNTLIDDGLCEQVCVPTINDPQYVYSNWISNDNQTQWPQETFSFWLFNITNTADIEINGSTPVIERVGPFVYDVHRYKYNVQFDDQQPPEYVFYQTQEMYTFNATLSTTDVSVDDMIYSINLAFLGGVQQSYTISGSPMYPTFSTWCSTFPYEDGAFDQACLWSYRTVQETIWLQFNKFIANIDLVFFNNQTFFNYNFSLFFNETSNEDATWKKSNMANYGMGGKCDIITSYLGPFCKDPASTPGADIRHQLNTGYHSLSDTSKFVRFLGNDSVYVWNKTVNGGIDPVRGNDEFQQKPWLSKDDTVTVFDDLLLRPIDFEYLQEESSLGVTYWRWVTKPEFFDATTPIYNVMNGSGTPGLVDASVASSISHGVLAPVFISREWLAGTNLSSLYICTNCPTPDQLSNNLRDYEPYLLIEPTTGKTVGGNKRGQFNAHIGQDYLFYNVSNCALNGTVNYCAVPDVYLPVFMFENGAMFQQSQADQLTDGLNQIDMANKIKLAAIVIGSILAAFSFIGAIYLFIHWKRLPQVEALLSENQNWQKAGGDASYIQHGSGGGGGGQGQSGSQRNLQATSSYTPF